MKTKGDRARRVREGGVGTAPRGRPQQRTAGRRLGFRAAMVGVAVAAVSVMAFGLVSGDGQESRSGQPVEAFMHLHGLEVPPWAPEVVYVATHSGLARIEADGTWRWASNEAHDFMGFSVHPTRPGMLYSSGHPAVGSRLRNPIGFMVSTDAGVTWAPRALQGEADFHAMAVQPGDGQVVYGWNVTPPGGLYRSLDGGHQWDRIPAAPLESAGVLTLAIAADDPDRLWAGTDEGLLRSHDGGRSWVPVRTGAPVSAIAIDPSDPSRLLAYVVSPDQGLVATTDDGDSWTPMGLSVGNDPVGHLAVHPHDPGTTYAGTYGGSLHVTTDRGDSWELLAQSGTPPSS